MCSFLVDPMIRIQAASASYELAAGYVIALGLGASLVASVFLLRGAPRLAAVGTLCAVALGFAVTAFPQRQILILVSACLALLSVVFWRGPPRWANAPALAGAGYWAWAMARSEWILTTHPCG